MDSVPLSPSHLGVAFVAALLAGAINSVAGGGTLVSFPALVWLGLPSIVANATSTAGIWPGTVGSLWGFRPELARADRRMFALTAPFLAGGVVGAWLLRATSTRTFDRIVPFLILFATVLFALRGAVQAWLRRRSGGGPGPTPLHHLWAGIPIAFAVGVYGGYFGAGMGIMNLSVLALLGCTDLLEMAALTSLYGLVVNAVAIAVFAAVGLIHWAYALAMAGGALVGGYGAAGVARRIGRVWLGRFVVAVGFAVSAIFFVRKF
jgi:uncharacterized membrane protein YfcA